MGEYLASGENMSGVVHNKHNKHGKQKPLMAEVYKFQEWGALLLRYLKPPNGSETCLQQFHHAVNACVEGMYRMYWEVMSERMERIPDLEPVAKLSFIQLKLDRAKFIQRARRRMEANVWKG